MPIQKHHLRTSLVALLAVLCVFLHHANAEDIKLTLQTMEDFHSAEQAAARKPVLDQDYSNSLKRLVADLTKKGEIEQAMEAQAKVDHLGTLPGKEPATAKPATEQAQSEWKNKALAEFPELSNPNSPLSKRVQSLKELKRNQPSYFSNPQWPYLLTQEASKALEPDTSNSRFCGLYYNTGKIVCFPFHVDETGKVSGAQFNLQAGDGPVISGNRKGKKLVTKWFALINRKPHDFTFTLLPDGNLDMEGDHGFDEKFHHKETLTRISDHDEYERVLKRIADTAKNDEINAIVSKLKAP